MTGIFYAENAVRQESAGNVLEKRAYFWYHINKSVWSGNYRYVFS
jgi:hypothetical protein